MSHLFRSNARVQLLILGVILTGVDGSAKTPTAAQYKTKLMHTFLKLLFSGNESVKLPDRYFAVYNLSNRSDTQFRFNLSDGLLILRGPLAHKADINVCDFKRGVWPTAVCRLPIPGTYAVYDGALSYGKDVSNNFTLLVDTMPYGGEWNNPADVSAHFEIRNLSENASLVLTYVAVTEFDVLTTSFPPFENFTVFKQNQSLIDYVWWNFTDYVFRKCKQDIRKELETVYTKRMKQAASAVGTFDSTLLLQ